MPGPSRLSSWYTGAFISLAGMPGSSPLSQAGTPGPLPLSLAGMPGSSPLSQAGLPGPSSLSQAGIYEPCCTVNMPNCVEQGVNKVNPFLLEVINMRCTCIIILCVHITILIPACHIYTSNG